MVALFVSLAPPPASALPDDASAAIVAGLLRPSPSSFRGGVLWLRDDLGGRLRRALVELARRSSGRKMILRLADSAFITVLASTTLRTGQAGLWGLIFDDGRPIGATIQVDLSQILALDHDPSGVETLAHELRHQIDASRAFSSGGEYLRIYRAALLGDRSRSAQRYGRRVRLQRPNISTDEALRWIEPLLAGIESSRPSTPTRLMTRP